MLSLLQRCSVAVVGKGSPTPKIVLYLYIYYNIYINIDINLDFEGNDIFNCNAATRNGEEVRR